jgi:heme exporter protein A
LTKHNLKSEHLELFRNDDLIFSDVSFELLSGQHLIVNGSNGSGKTSLLRTICGLTVPSGGLLYWDGIESQTILIFPLTAGDDQTHKNGLLAELTGKENLEYTLGISTGEKEKLRIIEGFNLTAFMDQLAGKLSHGQRRKIALSKIVQSGKILWILDEPFANLDGKGTAFLISEIQSHLNHGGMLISTENTDQPIIDSDINFNLDAP